MQLFPNFTPIHVITHTNSNSIIPNIGNLLVTGHTGQHCPSGVTGLGQWVGRAHNTVLQSRAHVGQAQGSSGSEGMISLQSAGRMQGLSGQITGAERAWSCSARAVDTEWFTNYINM